VLNNRSGIIAMAVLLLELCATAQHNSSPAAQNGEAAPATSKDCSVPAQSLPAGTTRIYIALREGKDGSGKSASDARDGSTVESFDRILRCYSEGCTDAADSKQSVARTENLIVCLGPGKFETKGQYDFLIDVPHRRPEGFTIGKGWKIHGAGIDRTTVQLSTYLPITSRDNPQNAPPGSGLGVVFATNSDDASGIEISDLTVDANYPALKPAATKAGIKALNLEGIHLRSDRGGHWIHDVRIINTAGEVSEAFPVMLFSVQPKSQPEENNGNLIERVRLSNFGGGKCTAIAVANAVAEVRNNVVEGLQIGYGGWVMGPVWFHDNVARDTEYGFNIDSLDNHGVRIERNQIIHPRSYGIVVGGTGAYEGFKISGNTIQINKPGVIGLVFSGNVTGADVSGNAILADSKVRATAIRNYAGSWSAGPNVNNIYESNRISRSLRVRFNGLSWMSRSCIHGNQDENDKPSGELKDNHQGSCVDGK
jgi:hypothetical protein